MDANSLSTAASMPYIDTTTLYYTYSTIAQTLAGAFGIIGAFVLFRLQGLNQSIRAFATGARECLGYHITFDEQDTAFKMENWDMFLKSIEDSALSKLRVEGLAGTLWKYVRQKDDLKGLRELLRIHLKTRRFVILCLKKTAKVTALTIILSLVLLPLSPLLAHNILVSMSFLLLALSFTIFCITQYVNLISSALTESPEKSSEDK
jgi:hypothetical protein